MEFAALGSGGPNAISVLESELYAQKMKLREDKLSSIELDNTKDIRWVYVEDAVNIIRKAVKSGILNDLGSGNFLDICIIKEDGVNRWRETVEEIAIHDNENFQMEAIRQDDGHDHDNDNDNGGNFDSKQLGKCIYSRKQEQERRTRDVFGVKTGVSVSNLVE